MALVRVCDKCMRLVEDGDYINIEYNKHFEGGFLSSRISITLCEECFEKEYGKGHLEALISGYQMERYRQRVEAEQIGEKEE